MARDSRPGATWAPTTQKTTASPLAELMEGLTRELATQFHESKELQSVNRNKLQKPGFALREEGE